MVDVFISYSRRDQEMVATLAHAIEAEGYDVWWDVELPPHQSYGDVITAKIAATKAALVVWSADAVASEWVRAEADMARNQRKLIQTSLNRVMPPLPFNQIQYAELDGWRGEPDHPGWRKVKMSLTDLCGPRAARGDVPVAEGARTGRLDWPTPPAPAAPQLRPEPGRPAVQPGDHPQPQGAPPAPSKWPLFAGIGVGAVALAAAGGLWLGQRGTAPAAAPAAAAPALAGAVPGSPAPAAAEPAAPAAAGSAGAAAASGDELAAVDGDEVPLEPNPADLTFPDSSTRLLTPSEVTPLGPSTLKVARNEIYARKGRRFNDPWLRDYFSHYAWYRPRFDEVPLNAVERSNVALLRQSEMRFR